MGMCIHGSPMHENRLLINLKNLDGSLSDEIFSFSNNSLDLIVLRTTNILQQNVSYVKIETEQRDICIQLKCISMYSIMVSNVSAIVIFIKKLKYSTV